MKIDDEMKDYKFSLRHAFLDRYAIVVRSDDNYDQNNITLTQKRDIIYFLRKSLNEKRSQLIFIRRMLKFYDSSFYMHGFFMHKKKEPDIYDHDLSFYMNSKFYFALNNYQNYNNFDNYYMHYYDITTMLNSYLFKYNKAGIRRYMNGIVRQLVYPFYFYSLPLFSYYKQLPFLASYFQKQQDV
jgi:hypothetical protein